MLSDYLTSRGFTYVGECPECGGQLVRKGSDRVTCTNYGGCELAPG